MNSTNSPCAASSPRLRGRPGQPEFGMWMTRKFGCSAARRSSRAGVLAVLVAVIGIAAVVVLKRQGDVSNPNVEFRSEAPPPVPKPPPIPTGRTDPLDRFVWPLYGYSKDRRRYLAAPASLRPPF